jgi:hypothetical protein
LSSLKPIQTFWNDLYFRSRLEARWAVFYDRLGIKYEYEKEGYNLGDGIYYLPDFWLPDQKIWVEVKPMDPNEQERQKAERLVAASGFNLAFAVGQIECGERCDTETNPHDIIGFSTDGYIWGDQGYVWCRCSCGKYGLEYGSKQDRICSNKHLQNYLGPQFHEDPILIAYRIARMWRFDASSRPIWNHLTDKITGYSYAKRIIQNGDSD